ncbi:MAG: RodZ domain-containing protein [Marinobacter sp.]
MTSDDNQQTVSNEPVGEQLKQAREKHGLSVSQIANAQHLRNGIIHSIENGDYGQIDSELFLKGYVRAYAKQVGLDSDAMIASLNHELEPARLQKERELEANPLIDIERRRRKKRRVAKLLLLIAAIVLIAAFVVMFVMPKFGFGEAGVETSAAAKIDQQTSEQSSPDDADMQVVPGSESEANFAGSATAAADAQQSQATDAGAGDSVPPDEDQIPVVTQVTEPVLAESPEGEEPDSAIGKLEIAFTGDCWVQVRDATGNRLVSSMKRAGERLEVSGEAPLNVVIGAVNTVKTIRFQGEIVDMGDFPAVNNRAEFTLTI